MPQYAGLLRQHQTRLASHRNIFIWLALYSGSGYLIWVRTPLDLAPDPQILFFTSGVPAVTLNLSCSRPVNTFQSGGQFFACPHQRLHWLFVSFVLVFSPGTTGLRQASLVNLVEPFSQELTSLVGGGSSRTWVRTPGACTTWDTSRRKQDRWIVFRRPQEMD